MPAQQDSLTTTVCEGGWMITFLVSVGAGAVLALWVLAGLAIALGAKSLNVIPMAWVRRVTAVFMLALAVWSAWGVLVG